jgi:C1q domain
MTFPVGPTNGQKANVNGVTYTYNSTLTAWTVSSNFLDSISANLVAANNITSSNTVVVGTTVSATGNITGGNLIGTIRTAAQTSITSVGTLSALSVTGNISGGNLLGTIQTAAQPNITSVGTLSALSVTGNVGIGTSSPGSKLDINRGSAGLIANFTDGVNTNFQIVTSSLLATIGPSAGSTAMAFKTSDTERMRIDSAGQVTTPSQPAFHAFGLNTVTNSSNIVFPSVVFNIGSHYNTSTGRFTAPVSGIYMFGWTSIGNNINDVYRWRFSRNGSTVGDLHLRQDTSATGGEYATNGMFTIPWQLNAGDFVNIFYISDSGTLPYGSGSTTDAYPRFWGYLLG